MILCEKCGFEKAEYPGSLHFDNCPSARAKREAYYLANKK